MTVLLPEPRHGGDLQWVTMRSRTVVALLTGATLAGLVLVGLTPPSGATPTRWVSPVSPVSLDARDAPVGSKSKAQRIDLTRWTSYPARLGRHEGTRATSAGVRLGAGPAQVRYDDPYGPGGAVRYQRGRWYSPWVRPGFAFDELIASYDARTPVGTFIEISVRGRGTDDRLSTWDSLGRWASHDTKFHRMSLGSQSDDLARVAVDTWVAATGRGLDRWQLRIALYARNGSGRSPVVTMLGAIASRLPGSMPTSRPSGKPGVDLEVPRYSQQIHRGHYPRWNGGGEAWCSPTSTSMVVGFWKRGPRPSQYAWVNHRDDQPWVDYAARNTYAYGYGGTGMWPFNTAYAGRFGLDAYVTRLRSLREAERFVRRGVPVVASIAFGAGELDGAPISSTAGHVLVIRGFTANGRVIVNDPAAPNNKTVRRVYKRGQFENAWIDTTGGAAYIIRR